MSTNGLNEELDLLDAGKLVVLGRRLIADYDRRL